MKNYVFLFSLCFMFCLSLDGQDTYHLELIESFQEENGLSAPTYVYNNTEALNFSATYSYGAAARSSQDVEGFDFTIQGNYDIPNAGENAWDHGTAMRSKSSVAKDDVIVFTFWAKRNGSSSEVLFFVEDAVSYDKEFYQEINFTPDFNQYFVAIQAGKDYGVDKLSAGFHLGLIEQNFELAGLTAFNFGPIPIEDVPSSFGVGAYEGSEADAPWRAAAEARIQDLRKADLMVKVVNMNGDPISDAEVKIEMQEHAFKFGSAFVTCRFEGNRCFDQTYVDKVFNLDGAGHGFNAGVTENAMKWDGWESEWIGTPDETAAAVKYLSDNGVQMRGHTLIWPGYSNMPDDIQQNKDNLNYLRNRIQSRIDEMINHPVLSEVVREWDVLNEITQNRSLESAFSSDPNFTTGREIYVEILDSVRQLDPDLKLYINDYIVLSGGGSSSGVVRRYKEYLDEIHNSSQPFDGIGFQAHIGGTPTSIVKAEEVFDEFYERYGKRLSVTEYDISDLVDPEVQANYMRDFLTLTFSHPAMDAFIMWGFWDGNHWKQNAPMFDMDWNLKPSGQAFIDLVFKDWWTNETLLSGSDGLAPVNAYKGKYIVTVTKGDETVEVETQILEDGELLVELVGPSSTEDLFLGQLAIVPSIISNGTFKIESTEAFKNLSLDIYTISGLLALSFSEVNVGEEISIDLSSGMYIAKINTDKGTSSKKIQVIKH